MESKIFFLNLLFLVSNLHLSHQSGYDSSGGRAGKNGYDAFPSASGQDGRYGRYPEIKQNPTDTNADGFGRSQNGGPEVGHGGSQAPVYSGVVSGGEFRGGAGGYGGQTSGQGTLGGGSGGHLGSAIGGTSGVPTAEFGVGQPAGYGESAERYRGGQQGGYDAYQDDRNAKEQYPPQMYQFDYNIRDEDGNSNYRQEHRDENGNVKGSYGYTDIDGLFRVVEYVADANGYRANLRTNEPGVGAENPADVFLTVEPVPDSVLRRYVQSGGYIADRAYKGNDHGGTSNAYQGSSAGDAGVYRGPESSGIPRYDSVGVADGAEIPANVGYDGQVAGAGGSYGNAPNSAPVGTGYDESIWKDGLRGDGGQGGPEPNSLNAYGDVGAVEHGSQREGAGNNRGYEGIQNEEREGKGGSYSGNYETRGHSGQEGSNVDGFRNAGGDNGGVSAGGSGSIAGGYRSDFLKTSGTPSGGEFAGNSYEEHQSLAIQKGNPGNILSGYDNNSIKTSNEFSIGLEGVSRAYEEPHRDRAKDESQSVSGDSPTGDYSFGISGAENTYESRKGTND